MLGTKVLNAVETTIPIDVDHREEESLEPDVLHTIRQSSLGV
jgi:hypothetical protein